MIDCSNIGNGIVVPSRMNRITKMISEAKFILVVENYSVLMRWWPEVVRGRRQRWWSVGADHQGWWPEVVAGQR